MKLREVISLTLVLLLLLNSELHSSASASTISLVKVFDGSRGDVRQQFKDCGIYWESSSSLTSTQPTPTLTADFSELGETQVDFVFQAPENHLIEISMPAARIEETADCRLTSLTRFTVELGNAGGLRYDVPISRSFEDLEFFVPGFFDDLGNMSATGMRAVSFFENPGGSRIRFSSMTLTLTIPESFDVNFVDATPFRFDVGGSVGFFTDDNPLDPGEEVWMNVVPVPEPSSLAMLGVCGWVLTRRRIGGSR